jgi:hypothetical protein
MFRRALSAASVAAVSQVAAAATAGTLSRATLAQAGIAAGITFFAYLQDPRRNGV